MAPAPKIDQTEFPAPRRGRARMSEGTTFWWPSKQGLTSAKTRAFRDHWRTLCEGRPMPPRGALDPLAITTLLPHIVLVDVLHDTAQLRYRLIGTFVTGLAGRDATGRILDRSLYGSYLEAMIWPYEETVRTAAPVATLSGVLFAERDWHCVENLFVPFGADGAVEMLATCVDVDRDKVQRDLGRGLILDWTS